MLKEGLIIAALLAMPGVAFADAKADLQARYDAIKAAIAAHDDTAIRGLLTPDFQSVDINGQVENASQMIAEIQVLKPDPNKKSQTTLLSVAASGNTAEVEQAYEMTTQKTGANRQGHAVKLTTQSHDVWKLIGITWLMSSTRTEQMDYEVDGKVVVHKQAQN